MIALFTLLVIVDQVSKLFAKSIFPTQINTGSVFGLYIGKFPLFSLAIAFLALVILLADLIRRKKIGIGEILILAGGVGNLIDRLFRPGVVDWINFYGLWFNLADTYITLGVTLIICKIFLKSSLNSLVIRK
jgi:signal peptidase II